MILGVGANAQEVDYTDHITNANLASTDGWTFTVTEGQAWSSIQGSEPSFVIEAYAGWGNLDLKAYSMKQNVTLPSGKYRAEGYAFYRYGLNATTDPSKSYAKFVAGDFSAPVVTLGGEALDEKLTAYPNSTGEASAAFTNGYYKSIVEFSIESEQTIPFGYEGTHELKQSWFIAGPIKLFRTGDFDYELYIQKRADKIAEAEALYSLTTVTDDIITTLKNVVDTEKAKECKTVADYNAVCDAIDAAIAKFNADAEAYKLSKYFIDFAAGKYYIIDAETGLMMAAGHNYGTRGIVNELGLDLTLTPNAETHAVTFDSQVSNGGNSHFLGTNLYMDSGAFGWYLDYQGFGFFITNGTQYINLDADNNLEMSDTPREWVIVTAEGVKEQRLEELAEATAEAPVDATFLIQGANFNRNDARNNTWETWSEKEDGNPNLNISGGNQTNNCAESFHAKFFVKQTINGAPAGIYKLTAQGFYRQDDDVTEDTPVFFVNDMTAEVPAKTGSENSMNDASNSFTNGTYTIEPIEFEVKEDGTFTVGIKNETALHQWIIFDNFKLTYYGLNTSTAINEVAKKVAQKTIFNVAGQQMNGLQKGLNIVGGKKVYVK